MSEAIIGWGTKLKRGDGDTPEVFTQVPEVVSLDPADEEIEKVDVTHLDSPQKRREYIQGMIDSGELSFSVNMIPSNPQHAGLLADKNSGTVRNFQVVYPFDPILTVEFAAIVTGAKIDEVEGNTPLRRTFTLTLSGAQTES
jgi:hypothetical protein